MTRIKNVKVIIPASGSGSRFGSKLPKQFLKLHGNEIIALTICKFHDISCIDEIIIAAQKKYFVKINSILKKFNFVKVKKVIEGGSCRQDSVYNALKTLQCSGNDIVLVHDAVRPFVPKKLILNLIKSAEKYGSVIPALPVSDTLKKVNPKGIIENTLNRHNIWTAQTPQAFRYEVLDKSFRKAVKSGFKGTDEASLAEYAKFNVRIIKGDPLNVKITTKEDLVHYLE